MKLKYHFLILSITFLLSGCAGQSTVKEEATIAYKPTVSSVETSTINKTDDKKASDIIWDEFVKRCGNDVMLGASAPSAPDLYPLYIEGMKHKSPNVRWFCAHNVIEYANHEKKLDIIKALEPLQNDSDENVSKAAKFSYSVLTFEFDGPEFAKSPSGNVAFNNYQDTRFNDGKLWLYSAEYKELWLMKEFTGSIMGISWSPDEKKIAVAYGGRTWCDISVLNVDTHETVESGLFQYIIKNKNSFGYKIGKNNRADPWITFLDWSPKSDNLLLAFKFFDDNADTQHGAAVLNLKKQAIEKVIPYGRSDADNPSTEKPKGFKW